MLWRLAPSSAILASSHSETPERTKPKAGTGIIEKIRLRRNSSSAKRMRYISFNKKNSWYDGTGTPEATQTDLLSVATHESGHCIRLGDVASGRSQ